jgi:CBS-domain-containing membrane protein
LYLWKSEASFTQKITEGIKKLTLGDYEKKKRDIVWISPDETVGHTIKLLTQHKMYIPATPVIDDKEKCQRLISIEDLISFVLNRIPDPSLIRSHEHDILYKIFETRIGDILGEIPRSVPEFIGDDKSVLDALERFGRCVNQLCLIRHDGS